MNECYGGNETRIAVRVYDMIIRCVFCANVMPRTVEEYDMRRQLAGWIDKGFVTSSVLNGFVFSVL
jgi:hypothetical protein